MLQQLQQFAQDPNTACDKLFILEAAKGNMKEQKLAEQVLQKVQNDQVKKLAQQIMQDHQQAQQQLQQAAQKLGVQLPQDLPQTEQVMIQIITSQPADQLEKHYVAGMNADHARDILKYQSEATMGKDDAAKQYAQQTLPKLQQHQQMTIQTAQAIGVQTGMEAVTAGSRIGPDSSSGASDRSGSSSSSGNTSNGSSSGASGASGTSGSSGAAGSAGSSSGSGSSGSNR